MQPKIDKKWPQNGCIEFKNVDMRYRPTTQKILRKLSFKINSGEKIGVVGRTGSGKSSITLALTRMVEICSGSIEIDGVDICKMSLNQLREHITIIPQDPILFKGTLRYNLDPAGICQDNEIIEILKKADLVEHIFKLKHQIQKMNEKKYYDKSSAYNMSGFDSIESAKLEEGNQETDLNQMVENNSILNFNVATGGHNLSSGEK